MATCFPTTTSSEASTHRCHSRLSPSLPNKSYYSSSLSDREAKCFPDSNILDCCLTDSSTMDKSCDITAPQADSYCDGNRNTLHTFICTPVNGSVNFWNENLGLMSDSERGLEKNQTFCINTVDVSDSTDMFPDSALRKSRLGSSSGGSTEMDNCSSSSGEMVMRSNSFFLDDQSVLQVSSSEKEAISPVACFSTLPSKSYLLSSALPDVCKRLTQRISKRDTGHPPLDKTFTQREFSTEGDDMSLYNSPVSLKEEDKGPLFMTFVCETPSDCGKDAHSPGLEAGKAVEPFLLAVQVNKKKIRSSTPVQTMKNKTPSSSSFPGSPCTRKPATPGLFPVKQQKISGTPKKPWDAGLLVSKFNKIEINKFPKFDISKVKCKVVTRHLHHVSDNASHHRPSSTKVINNPTESHRGTATRVSPAKVGSCKSKRAVALLDDDQKQIQGRPSPRQSKAASVSQPSATSPRPKMLLTRRRPGTLGSDQAPKAVETRPVKLKSNTGSQRIQTTGGPFLGTVPSASLKSQPNRCFTPQTPTASSHLQTPASRLPRKALERSRSFSTVGIHNKPNEVTGSAQVSGGAAQRQTPFRAAVLKPRLFSSPGNNARPALASACKPPTPTSKVPLNIAVRPLKKTSSARSHQISSELVDKSKARNNSNPQPRQQASQPNWCKGPPDVVRASIAKVVTKDQNTQQLREQVAASDRRFEAFTIVLQQSLSEREEATKHCKELSQELDSLKGELVRSVHSSERLEKEKNELRITLEEALHKLQWQHQRDLADLEQRLKTFYQAEWDKVHITYQEEADKYKTLMQQQMAELKCNHEAIQLEKAKSHAEDLQCVEQQYLFSLEELREVHSQELLSLNKTLKDTEAALYEKMEELKGENNVLIEKLVTDENRRKEVVEKCQKDSNTLYLEQELESLKVVLDMKNEQLHQQEQKLMEVEKLKEKNVKLDDILKRVQQENEDLKTRMDRHAALSRQLSTEQAVLQESLQKESTVNKRLSMENEELLWKLHNGDLNSLRKVSPTSSPSTHSFSFQSPRSSGLFSSPPVSPR